MKLLSRPMLRSTLISGLVVVGFGFGCKQNSQSATQSDAPVDIEAAYMALSSEVQNEVLGLDARPSADVRRELMAKADKDGDGQLSDQEKADLRAQWKEIKETMRAEWKAALDKDKDGSISPEEKQAALENLGQEIKAAIQETLADLHAAQKETQEKIRAACGANKPDAAALRDGAGSTHGRPSEDEPADELDVESTQQDMEKELTACQAVVQAEKDKMHEAMKSAWESLHAELDKLKEKLDAVENAQAQ